MESRANLIFPSVYRRLYRLLGAYQYWSISRSVCAFQWENSWRGIKIPIPNSSNLKWIFAERNCWQMSVTGCLLSKMCQYFEYVCKQLVSFPSKFQSKFIFVVFIFKRNFMESNLKCWNFLESKSKSRYLISQRQTMEKKNDAGKSDHMSPHLIHWLPESY